jgi:PAS domain S-box-containing protein
MVTKADLLSQVEVLEQRLRHSEQALRALESGEIDSIVRDGASTPFLLQAAQDQLLANEQLLRAVFDSAMDAMLIADDSGTYVDANPAACVIFGLEKHELVGRRIAEFTAPDYASGSWNAFLKEGRSRGEFPLVRLDGQRRDLEYSSVANVLPGLHLSILRDITERKASEKALHESERRLRTVISNAPVVLFGFDNNGNYTLYEGKGVEALGRASEDRVGRSVFETFGLLVDAEPAIRRSLAGEVTRWEGLTRGGFYEAILIPEFGPNGVVLGVTGLGIDVNARKLMESELRESELRYRRIVDNTSEGVWMYDGTGITTFMNPRMAEMLGYTVQEAIGKPIFTFMDPSLVADATERLARRKAGASARGRFRLKRRDGSDLWISLHADPLFDADGNFESSLALATDITEQLKSEAALDRSEGQLRQAQKMEAIGSLAGGVAHDFNNLLSVILGYSEMIITDLKPNDPLRADLLEIRSAGLRATTLTRQLLAFSRQQVLQPTVLDLNSVVSGVEKMLARLLGEDIELSWVTSPDAGQVHADAGQLEQVIMNLVVNARDAMPNGGRLTIKTANVVVDESVADHADIAPGRYVVLAVADTGTGIDSATKDRIFEPFFTTKEKSKGTGLGLSTVYGIVRQSGGHIIVDSELGKGTTFKIYLPQTDRSATPLSLVADQASPLEGTETVLLVEDEDAVRAIMKSILLKHGYQVLEAQNGGEAFLICEQPETKIDLLVTDVVMPRMSGRKLSDRLLALRPDLKVLYVSGYTDKMIVQHGVDVGVAYLQKPIMPEALLRKVRDVLDARA